jgi:hypothetical protein
MAKEGGAVYTVYIVPRPRDHSPVTLDGDQHGEILLGDRYGEEDPSGRVTPLVSQGP